MKFDRKLATIVVIMITEVLGFSLVLPFLPFYAQELGASAFEVGLILSLFSLFQFFSAPVMGRLSDIYGRRPLLMISQLSTVAGFLILAMAKSLPILILARVVDGALGSNFVIAQAYLSDISTKKDRSKYFGLSGMAFGIGFLIGPAIGGYLATFGYAVPSLLAAGVASVTILTTYLFLPETVERDHAIKFKIKVLDTKAFSKFLKQEKTRSRLGELGLNMMAHNLFVASFALFAERQVGFGAREVGMLMMFIGLISVILRGPMLPKLIDWWGEEKLLYLGVVFMTSGLGLVAMAGELSLGFLYAGMACFAFGAGVTRPLIMGAISRRVSEKEQGALMGVTNSMASMTQMVSPLLGGLMIQTLKPGWVPAVAAGFAGGVLVLMKRNGLAQETQG